jgi:hypothetical protein
MTLPSYLTHPDRDTQRLLTVAWCVREREEARDEAIATLARVFAGARPGDVGPVLDACVSVLNDIELCRECPAEYAYCVGESLGAGMSWAEWSGLKRDELVEVLHRSALPLVEWVSV